MADITEGTWFAYQYNVTVGGRPTKDTAIERFTVKKIDGSDVTVLRDINNSEPAEVPGNTAFGCFVFDLKGFEKRGSENMTTQFGHMYVSIYEKEENGVSERMFVGKDNIVFRKILTKHMDNGLLSETHELCWSNMKI